MIQIHAYARTAKEVLDKIEAYREVFAEDFEGRNGRKKKTLWLTEVAAGSADGSFVRGFVEDLLSPETGALLSRLLVQSLDCLDNAAVLLMSSRE